MRKWFKVFWYLLRGGKPDFKDYDREYCCLDDQLGTGVHAEDWISVYEIPEDLFNAPEA